MAVIQAGGDRRLDQGAGSSDVDGFATLKVKLTGLGEGVGAGAERRKYKNRNSKISGEPTIPYYLYLGCYH